MPVKVLSQLDHLKIEESSEGNITTSPLATQPFNIDNQCMNSLSQLAEPRVIWNDFQLVSISFWVRFPANSNSDVDFKAKFLVHSKRDRLRI